MSPAFCALNRYNPLNRYTLYRYITVYEIPFFFQLWPRISMASPYPPTTSWWWPFRGNRPDWKSRRWERMWTKSASQHQHPFQPYQTPNSAAGMVTNTGLFFEHFQKTQGKKTRPPKKLKAIFHPKTECIGNFLGFSKKTCSLWFFYEQNRLM